VSILDVAASRGAKVQRANDVDIAYVEVGDGPSLVLLQGAFASTGPAWAGSNASFVDHFARLGESFRVIAPDTRGSGATVHPGGSAGFETLAADVAALIRALELDRPFLAGFSEGGATATLVALEHPTLVGALVNYAGFDYFDGDHMSQQLEHGFRPAFGGRPGATAADPDAALRTFSATPMAATFATMQADFDSAQGEGRWRDYLCEFFDRTTAGVGRTTDDLAALDMPTLIAVGDRDMLCPVELACATFRRLSAGQLAIIPNTAHEISTAVVEVLSSFLLAQT
jgi:pimeloyl-ACP methyl ester carboxylesterase